MYKRRVDATLFTEARDGLKDCNAGMAEQRLIEVEVIPALKRYGALGRVGGVNLKGYGFYMDPNYFRSLKVREGCVERSAPYGRYLLDGVPGCKCYAAKSGRHGRKIRRQIVEAKPVGAHVREEARDRLYQRRRV